MNNSFFIEKVAFLNDRYFDPKFFSTFQIKY